MSYSTAALSKLVPARFGLSSISSVARAAAGDAGAIGGGAARRSKGSDSVRRLAASGPAMAAAARKAAARSRELVPAPQPVVCEAAPGPAAPRRDRRFRAGYREPDIRRPPPSAAAVGPSVPARPMINERRPRRRRSGTMSSCRQTPTARVTGTGLGSGTGWIGAASAAATGGGTTAGGAGDRCGEAAAGDGDGSGVRAGVGAAGGPSRGTVNGGGATRGAAVLRGVGVVRVGTTRGTCTDCGAGVGRGRRCRRG